MQRPEFQDGRILRTSDFVDEQAYHLAAHRRHNVTGHAWGVAAGLDLVTVDRSSVVSPGRAVDGYGRDIVLDRSRSLDLRGFDVRGIDAVDVWIGYDRTRASGTGDGVDLLVDDATIQLTAARDLDPRRPPGVDEADLAAHPTRPPDDPARRWPVYLGRIRRDLAHPETPPVIETDRRPWIGLVGATVEVPGGSPWLELQAGANPSVTVHVPGAPSSADPALRISADQGVELNSRLTVDGELVLRGGSLTLDPAAPALAATPAAPALAAPPAAPEWSLSHAEDTVAHELRLAMPPAGSGTVPSRFVVGTWKDGAFAPSLAVDEDGTVLVAGNLVVRGRLQASSVQEAQLSDAARAYLAGLQATSLLALFQVLPPSQIN